jgi:hypothetical protein
MAPATMEAASVEAATMDGLIVETASVESVIVEVVIVKSAMEVVIVKSAIEISANKAAEADATVIGPTMVPVRIIPGGIGVIRYGRDTAWRGWLRSTGNVRSSRGV